MGLQEQKFKRQGAWRRRNGVSPANMHHFYWQGFAVIHLIFLMAPRLNAVEIKCHCIEILKCSLWYIFPCKVFIRNSFCEKSGQHTQGTFYRAHCSLSGDRPLTTGVGWHAQIYLAWVSVSTGLGIGLYCVAKEKRREDSLAKTFPLHD